MFAYTLPEDVVSQLGISKHQKIYVLVFYKDDCVPCQKEFSSLKKLNTVIDKNKIEIIFVNNTNINTYYTEKLKEVFKIVYDKDNKITSVFDVQGYPSIYYVKQQQIVSVLYGFVQDIDEKIYRDLQKLKDK